MDREKILQNLNLFEEADSSLSSEHEESINNFDLRLLSTNNELNTNSSDYKTTTTTTATSANQLPNFENTFRNIVPVYKAYEQRQSFAHAADASDPTTTATSAAFENLIFEFKRKPSKYFCFEYPTNFERAASYLKASNNAAPSVRFETSNSTSNELYLHMDLYEKSNERFQFSPHALARKKNELRTVPIFEKMRQCNLAGNRRGFELEFQKFYIHQAAEKIRQTIFIGKIEEFNKKIVNATPHAVTPYVPISSDFGVMLGCQVFQQIGNLFQPITERIYSDIMYPENLLSISIKQNRFKSLGGEIIGVEIKKSTAIENLRVLLNCKGIEGKHAAWQEICNLKLESNTTSFMTPRCNAHIMDPNITAINCDLRLITVENIFCSKPIKIVCELPARTRERKRTAEIFENVGKPDEEPELKSKKIYFTDSQKYASQSVFNAKKTETLLDAAIRRLQQLVVEDAPDKSDRFLELNDAYARKNEDENSIIHDAIADDKYLRVYKILKRSSFRAQVSSLRNKYGETPLHYACKLGKRHFVLSLCPSPLPLYLQDNKKQTPLHIAINVAPACLVAFQTLILDEHYASEELKTALPWLLQLYDENGLTFLHLAVMKQCREFVEAILIYCQRQNIDACQFGTLQTGDTILHLAKQAEMYDLILKHKPNAHHYTNYAGEHAFKIVDLVDDLQKITL